MMRRSHERAHEILSADFVVCRQDGAIVAVIELDDSSHSRAYRKQADAKKDKALASAGLRIIRWQARSLPDGAAIRATFAHTQPANPADGYAAGEFGPAGQGHTEPQSSRSSPPLGTS
jgi:hypothetical protein